MRIAIVGMGSHFGTSLAKHLDADPSNHLLGVDIEPPRRHLHRARFCLVQPDEGDRVVELLREFEPTAVVHLGVFEPHARSNPAAARTRTLTMTDAVIEVAETCPTVDRIVVRSGIEVYGRGRGTPLRPDEDLAPEPTSGYGRTLWAVEQRLVDAGRRLGTAVARLRFAPVAGPHIPSPVTRYLRLPVVPVALVPDPPFSLLHIDDASDAMVAALARRFDGVVNVVGPGAVTGSQAHETSRVDRNDDVLTLLLTMNARDRPLTFRRRLPVEVAISVAARILTELLELARAARAPHILEAKRA